MQRKTAAEQHQQEEEWFCNDLCVGKLHMVDLAGSDRLELSRAMGETLKESQYINTSINALGEEAAVHSCLPLLLLLSAFNSIYIIVLNECTDE